MVTSREQHVAAQATPLVPMKQHEAGIRAVAPDTAVVEVCQPSLGVRREEIMASEASTLSLDLAFVHVLYHPEVPACIKALFWPREPFCKAPNKTIGQRHSFI